MSEPVPSAKPEPTPFERINLAVKQLEIIAHHQNPQPHDPQEQIYFPSWLRDGREVEVYVDYEQPQGEDEIRLQLVFPNKPLATESYMIDPHDWSGRRAGATVPGEKLEGAAVAARMAERFEEVLIAATDSGVRFDIIYEPEESNDA